MKAFVAGDFVFTAQQKTYHQGTEQSISEQIFFRQDHFANTKQLSEQPGNHACC
jgi:hypothetical protein